MKGPQANSGSGVYPPRYRPTTTFALHTITPSKMSAQVPDTPPPASSSGTDYAGLVQGSTDSTDQTLVIRQVVPGMITFSLPFVRPPLSGVSLILICRGEKS